MSKRPAASEYTGSLAEPIRVSDYPDFETALDAVESKLAILASHLGLDPKSPDFGVRLTATLLASHVAGFKIAGERKPRRARTWLADLGKKWANEVDNVIAERVCTQKEAIDLLRADKSKQWFEFSPATLAARYRDERRRQRNAQRDRIARLILEQELIANP